MGAAAWLCRATIRNTPSAVASRRLTQFFCCLYVLSLSLSLRRSQRRCDIERSRRREHDHDAARLRRPGCARDAALLNVDRLFTRVLSFVLSSPPSTTTTTTTTTDNIAYRFLIFAQLRCAALGKRLPADLVAQVQRNSNLETIRSEESKQRRAFVDDALMYISIRLHARIALHCELHCTKKARQVGGVSGVSALSAAGARRACRYRRARSTAAAIG